MRLTKAQLIVLDLAGSMVPGTTVTNLTGDITLTVTTPAGGQGAEAEIRRYVTDAALAEKKGQESGDHDVLMDWFAVRSPVVTIHDGRIRITGYQAGALGARRDGVSPYGHGDGNAYTDIDEPLVAVQWVLS